MAVLNETHSYVYSDAVTLSINKVVVQWVLLYYKSGRRDDTFTVSHHTVSHSLSLRQSSATHCITWDSNFVCFWRDNPPCGPWPPLSRDLLDHSHTHTHTYTQRRTTVGRTPLDEWSARRRDLYVTTHDTHDKRPCPRWDSNPQSQQANGRRPTPWTARPLGSAGLVRNSVVK